MSDKKREEQIKEAARQRADQYGHPSQWSDTYYGFIDGAHWADSHPQWIPVGKELPEVTIDDWRSENVFFATDDGKSHFGFYSNKGVWFSLVYGFNGHQVTHWMPLPAPPRKEE